MASSLLGPGVFRLILAGMVFVSHTSRLDIGREAVILFFMLSGYWVTRLYKQRGAQSVFGYLRDRFLRVWPLLAVVALLVALAFTIAGERYHGSLLSTLALLGLATRHGDVIGVSWSLDIELQFYAALPFVLVVISAIPASARNALTIALLVTITAIGALLIDHGIATALAYCPAFAAGSAIYLTRWKPSRRLLVASLLVFAAFLLAILLVRDWQWVLLTKTAGSWWYNLLQMALCAPLVPFVAWNVAQYSSPLDRHLGNLSFPFYLVHFPIVAACAAVTSSFAANKLIAFTLSSVAALTLYIFVDRQFERWRKTTTVRARVPDASAPRTLTGVARNV